MNITLSAEEDVVKEAREWAASHGTSLNALVRDFLARLGTGIDSDSAAEQFSRNAKDGAGRSDRGESYKRKDLYSGPRFGSSS